MDTYNTVNNTIEDSNAENTLDSLSITEKLLQNTDAESTHIVDIPNKIELMEKEDYVENNEIKDNDASTIADQSSEKAQSEIIISPEIYNTNTNHEQINKQRSQFEYLKNEIELFKSK